MWHALRAELDYFRLWFIGALGLAVGVVALVTVIFEAVGDEGPPPFAAAGLRAMFCVMAPVILGFVIQAQRVEERRIRLLVAGPLTPRQLAGVTVLIPPILTVVGLGAGVAVLAIDALATGSFAVESAHLAGYVGGLILMIQMLGLVAQEAVAAYRQGRRRMALAGWSTYGAAALIFAALSGAEGAAIWPSLHLGNVLVSVVAAAMIVALYSGRRDFTG